MPADYGKLSARDQARLRAARRRAGLTKPKPPPKPPRDTRTVSNVRAETKQREKAKRDFPTARPLPAAPSTTTRRVREVQAARNRQVTARGGGGGTSLPHPLAFGLGLLGKGQDMLADEVTTSVIQQGDFARGRGYTPRREAKTRAKAWEQKHPWIDAAAETFMDPFLVPDAISLGRLLARKGKKPPTPPTAAVDAPSAGLWREMSLDQIPQFFRAGRVTTNMRQQRFHMATDPSLALGQGKNKGVLLEFDPEGIQVARQQSKPGMPLARSSGVEEVVARYTPQETYMDNVRAMTIKAGTRTDAVTRARLKRILADLEERGWNITRHEDGSLTARRPSLGAAQIVEALPEAKKLRRQQEAGYRTERAEKTARAKVAREQAGGGEAGKRAARAEFAGELTKLPFTKLAKTFGEADSEIRKVFQPQVDALMDNISSHPAMGGLEYRIENTQKALRKTLDGVTPTKSEIKLLESVFGEEATEHFKWMAGRDKIIKAMNLPRSLQASYDISRTFRQDLVALARHPVIVGRNWPKMIKAGRDPEAARVMMERIVAHPRYEEAIEDGLAITDYRGPTKSIEEDMLGAEYAEKIPIIGKGVRFSNRAFNVGGAMNRMDIYSLLMDHAENVHRTWYGKKVAGKALTKTERRHLTNVINAETGRGNLDFGFAPASGSEVMEKAGPLLTLGLFSPRLMAARVAFLNPVYYARLSGPARTEAMRALLQTVAAGSAVLYAADKIPGVDVGMSPLSADFGKIRAGDTRIDIWGGFQQYVVNVYRYSQKETQSSTTGEVTPKTREDILWNFVSGKAAPIPAYGRDWQRGEDFAGQPFDPVKSAGKLFVPLNLQNAWGAKDKPKVAAASFGLGGVGLGMLNYAPATPEEIAEAKNRNKPPGSRDHEKRMAALKVDAAANGASPPADAVKASRRIRQIDLDVHRARLKNGWTNKLPSKQKAQIAFRTYRKHFPENVSMWKGLFADPTNDEARWQSYYEDLRDEIYEPFSQHGISWDN